MRPVSRLFACLAATVALTACDAKVRTAVDVSESRTTASVAVHLTGAAAESLMGDPSAEAQVLALFAGLAADTPEPTRAEGRWSARTVVPIEYLPSTSGYTALGSVVRSGTGESTTVTVTFAAPNRLQAAFDAAAAGRPDAVDVRAALGAATVIEVSVRFPGGVTAAPESVGALPVTRDADSVTLAFSVDEAPVGAVLAVSGDPVGGGRSSWLPVSAALAAVAAGLYLVFGRRHQRGASR